MTDSFSTDAIEEQEIRRRIHRRLEMVREVAAYAAVVGILAIIDWATGGGWWVQWLALIWGAFIAFKLLGEIGPALWGREAEDRMVRRELERRDRGR